MKNIVTVIMLILLFTGCKKNCKLISTNLDPIIKNHYHFKSGSYWLFRDSISGEIDSFYISQAEFKEVYNNDKYGNRCEAYERLKLQIKQRKDTSYVWNFLFTDNYILVELMRNKDEISYFTGHFFSEQEIHLKYHNGGVSHFSSKKNSDATLPFYLSYNSWQLNFIDSNASNTSVIYTNTYLYNDSLGFTKIRLKFDDGISPINKIWELQRWHVIK